MAQLSFEQFENFFRYYKGLEHQRNGIRKLFEQMRDVLKDDQHDWVRAYRNPSVQSHGTPLAVPYQSQQDNASGTGYRECFSSSCAMVAMYYKTVKNDDEYNTIRARFGDSTSAEAQVRALRSLGLEANFISNASAADLSTMLKEGRPIPVGWLHQGKVDAPTGGGHWSVVIGELADCWLVHDPYGCADLIEGGYVSETGAGRFYNKSLWTPRWEVEGPGSGWMLDIRDPAKK